MGGNSNHDAYSSYIFFRAGRQCRPARLRGPCANPLDVERRDLAGGRPESFLLRLNAHVADSRRRRHVRLRRMQRQPPLRQERRRAGSDTPRAGPGRRRTARSRRRTAGYASKSAGVRAVHDRLPEQSLQLRTHRRRLGGSEGRRQGAAAARVPTTFVQKYTPRAQLKPSGAPEPASGRGRPAAAGDRRGSVRKKRTFWPNSSAAWNMTRSVFRICQTKYPEPHFMDRPSTAQQDVRKPDPRHPGVHAKARHDLDELMSALQRGGTPPGRQRTLAARSVAGCSPRSSAT